MYQIKTEWLKGLKPDEAEKQKKSIIASKLVLDKLIEICYNIKKDKDKSVYNYDTPSWSYKQAHVNGYKQALDDIIQLITINERP